MAQKLSSLNANNPTFARLQGLAQRLGVPLPHTARRDVYTRNEAEAENDFCVLGQTLNRVQASDGAVQGSGHLPDLDGRPGHVFQDYNYSTTMEASRARRYGNYDELQVSEREVVSVQTRGGQPVRAEQIERVAPGEYRMYSLINDDDGLRANVTRVSGGEDGVNGSGLKSEYEKWYFGT